MCGKKHIFNNNVQLLKKALENEISRYGKRSNTGADKGIDSKSLSHCLRVLYELKEIVTTKDLKFPLKDAEYIKSVKTGEITDLEEVLNKIDELYDECMDLLAASDLPEEVDVSGMEDILIGYYF